MSEYKGWKETEWWQGTDYVVAAAVRRQLALHARRSECYGMFDHDNDECSYWKADPCEHCRRAYRQARWDLYRAAKAVCWDNEVGEWDRFADALKEHGPRFWD